MAASPCCHCHAAALSCYPQRRYSHLCVAEWGGERTKYVEVRKKYARSAKHPPPLQPLHKKEFLFFIFEKLITQIVLQYFFLLFLRAIFPPFFPLHFPVYFFFFLFTFTPLHSFSVEVLSFVKKKNLGCSLNWRERERVKWKRS